MPHNVDIKVYLLAKSQVMTYDRADIGKTPPEEWLEDLGVSRKAIERILDPECVNDEKTSAETIVEMAGRRCYKSFEVGLNPNIQQIREEIGAYIDNILKVGHGSVIEHASFTFGIENVSRVFTGEMNRHRAGMAISEGSMRFIRYEDIPYWVPTSIQEEAEHEDHKVEPGLNEKREQSRKVFDEVFAFVEKKYAVLAELWKDELAPTSKFKSKKEITSMMRRIIPMGVATGGIWTGNLRALRFIFERRCDSAAEEEILLVATKMLNIMRTEEPNFFKDFTTDEAGYSKPKFSKV